MGQSLVKILMERDDLTHVEASKKVIEMRDRVLLGETPEDVLADEGLECDYFFELI